MRPGIVHPRLRLARTLLAATAVGALLQGCASNSSLRPDAPPNAKLSAKGLVAQTRAATPGITKPDEAVTLDELKQAITQLRSDALQAAEQKSGQSWDNGLIALAGGAMATIGSVASKTGLTNTGLGLAFLGLSADYFFKPNATIDLHLDADSRLQCLQDATRGLTEAERVAAASVELLGSDEARKALDTVGDGINEITLSYRRALLGMRPAVPSRAELLEFMNRFAAAAAAAGAGEKDTPEKGKEMQAAAARKFIGLETSVQACVKLGVSKPK